MQCPEPSLDAGAEACEHLPCRVRLRVTFCVAHVTRHAGMSQDDAMQKYIDLVTTFRANYA